MFRRLLIASLLLPFIGRPAASQTLPFASWQGVLRGANGQLLPQAQITLGVVPPGAQFESATDDTGNFSFARLPAGTYTLSVRWREVSARAANAISLKPGERFEAWLELAPGGRILIHANRTSAGANRANPGGVAPNPNASTGGEKLTGREV
ncbi:MAG TPA: carboxypeptidase-like regulatory domain-containing protein, partial [Terriglobia bacterium]|nr:carboxypeptidase-like regulatory domain-containing protein [Terriglobia bacterium]